MNPTADNLQNKKQQQKQKNTVDIKDKNVYIKLIFRGYLKSATVQRIQKYYLLSSLYNLRHMLVTNQEGSTKVEGHMSSGLITSAA